MGKRLYSVLIASDPRSSTSKVEQNFLRFVATIKGGVEFGKGLRTFGIIINNFRFGDLLNNNLIEIILFNCNLS